MTDEPLWLFHTSNVIDSFRVNAKVKEKAD